MLDQATPPGVVRVHTRARHEYLGPRPPNPPVGPAFELGTIQWMFPFLHRCLLSHVCMTGLKNQISVQGREKRERKHFQKETCPAQPASLRRAKFRPIKSADYELK